MLTALPGAPDKVPDSPILEFPVTEADSQLAHSYSVTPDGFAAHAISEFWWEPIYLSLDRAAFQRLGLADRSLFEVSWEKPQLALTAIYLDAVYRLSERGGLWHPERFLREHLGQEFLQQFSAERKEAAVAFWLDRDAGLEQLVVFRWDGKKAYPAKYHGVWVECHGRIVGG